MSKTPAHKQESVVRKGGRKIIEPDDKGKKKPKTTSEVKANATKE